MTTINGRACVATGRNLFLNSGSNSGQTTLPGGTPNILGTYSRTDSYEQITPPSSGEYYYRFTDPGVSDNLWGLVAGGTYTISGQAVTTEGTLVFRAQANNGAGWYDFFGDGRYDLKATNSDGVTFTPFSYTFTIPTSATGIYLSLQSFDYTTNTVFRFKKMKLEKGSVPTPLSPAPVDKVFSDGRRVYGRNLLTGTGYHTVTGTANNGHLSNETNDDFLSLFQGLEGETVTISVDYEYQGFVAGSGENRIGWEINTFTDSAAIYNGPWYDAGFYNNSSGSGRMSLTFVVPENITSIGEGYGYIQFSGSGTGTLSHLKLEKGSVATPWTPAPEDVM